MRLLLLSAAAVLPWFVNSADVGVSWSISELSQPVQLSPANDQISAINNSVQISYSEQDWLIGLAISKANNSDSWTEQRTDSDNNLSYRSYEIYANYYHDNWTFSAAFGQSDIVYRLIRVRHMGANRSNYVDRRDRQEYDNKDNFYEFSSQYYLDLSEAITDLSVNFELGATHYNTQGDQRNETSNIQVVQSMQAQRYIRDNNIKLGPINAGRHEIDESVWIYSFAANFDYSFVLLNKDWLASAWFEKELSSQSDGSFTISRLRNNNRVIRQEFPLSEAGEQTNLADLNSYGVDLSLALSDRLSSHISWLDSDLGQSQLQFGLSYWF